MGARTVREGRNCGEAQPCAPALPLQSRYVMPVYSLGGKTPAIHPEAFVHPEACVIGDVTIGSESSVWPGAVLRGDSDRIVIGARTSVQDGAIIHCDVDEPTIVGDECVIGHLAHLEGCVVGNGVLIGTACVVLNRAQVGDGALIGANAVVTGGTVVPAGARAIGVPVRITEDAVPPGSFDKNVRMYVERAALYRGALRRVDG